MLNALVEKAHPYIPFTAWNTVWRSLDKQGRSILDLGCGKGGPMRFINRHKQFHCVGLDIFGPHLSKAKEQGSHNDYVLCDVQRPPIKEKTFDIVLCLEVLEHLSKEDGQKLIADMERIARRQVIVTTPLGRYRQGTFDENPYYEHKYIWSPEELKRLGYKVKTLGLRNTGGEGGLSYRIPVIGPSLGNVVWVLAGPFTRFFSRLAGEIVGIKPFEDDDCHG